MDGGIDADSRAVVAMIQSSRVPARGPSPAILALAFCACSLWACSDYEATAHIFDVDRAEVPTGHLEATDLHATEEGAASIDVAFHDDTPCGNLRIGLCNIDDPGPFELGPGFMDCDPTLPGASRANVQFSTGCDPQEGNSGAWHAIAGSLSLRSGDELVQLSMTADMSGMGDFTVEAAVEFDREDLVQIGP